MAKEVAGLIKLQIKGGAANPSPPVGPALGSKGINIMEFCKQFNARTQDKAGKICPANGLVTEQPQYSVVVCIFSTSQNTEISLIPNGLRLIYTCSLLLALPCIFHLARHTFATTVTLANQVSIENVSKMLGHSSIRMTQHYARILDASIEHEMLNVEKCYE